MRSVFAVVAAALVSLTGANVFANPDEAAPRQVLRATDGTFATPYSRKLATSSVSFQKTYAELSDAEKSRVRDMYVDMATTDEPPYPVSGMAPVMRAVSQGQDRRLAHGELFVVVDVDASGQATKASVYKTPDPVLGNYVAGVLLLQKFKPALCNGQPCAMPFPLHLQLDVD